VKETHRIGVEPASLATQTRAWLRRALTLGAEPDR